MSFAKHSAVLVTSTCLLLAIGCTSKGSDATNGSSDTPANDADESSNTEGEETGEPSNEETGEPEEQETGEPEEQETGEPEAPAYTIWSGPKITFTKENSADSADPANQDAITEHVILTRGDRGSLYNVVLEASASGSSPAGTEWSKGTTADIDSLTFDTLKSAANNQMQRIVGEPFVLHLIEDDVYLDITFLNWTPGGSGGGFSYERPTAE